MIGHYGENTQTDGKQAVPSRLEGMFASDLRILSGVDVIALATSLGFVFEMNGLWYSDGYQVLSL